MPALDQLNGLENAAFVDAVGAIYEHSPWVAVAVLPLRPFATVDALHAAMHDAVMQSPPDRQLALVRAHPQLLGRLAAPGELTASSQQEQAGAGLNRCSQDQLDALQTLNRDYLDKFGFPFVIAVRGLNAAQIIAQMELRLQNRREHELAACLQQIGRIARFRLEDLVKL